METAHAGAPANHADGLAVVVSYRHSGGCSSTCDAPVHAKPAASATDLGKAAAGRYSQIRMRPVFPSLRWTAPRTCEIRGFPR